MKTAAKKPAKPVAKQRERGPVCSPGEVVLVCTVTRYFVGRVVGIEGPWLKLDGAAWVPDTGRYGEALVKGIHTLGPAEVEPVPGDGALDVALGAITDVVRYQHALLRSVKG